MKTCYVVSRETGQQRLESYEFFERYKDALKRNELAKDWKGLRDCFIKYPDCPRPSILAFGLSMFAIPDCLSELLPLKGGVVLETQVRDEGTYQIFLCTRRLSGVLDKSKSVREKLSSGRLGALKTPVFYNDQLAFNGFFKVVESSKLFYLTNRDIKDPDFLDVYVKEKLSGLVFTKVWTSN